VSGRPGTAPRTRLNGRLLQARREELGLSRSELADATGMTPSTIRGLEGEGTESLIPLQMLDRLGVALAVESQALLTSAGQTGKRAEAETADDAATVGALLADERRLVRRADICSVLGWPAARLDRAVEALECQLTGTGMVVHHLRSELSIRREAETVSSDQLADLAARQRRTRGLQVGDARFLYKLICDGRTEGSLQTLERVAVARLTAAGLVARSPELTASARIQRALLR
jgi:transcriptional regulator with XRE-family HTH domain